MEGWIRDDDEGKLERGVELNLAVREAINVLLETIGAVEFWVRQRLGL